MASAKDVADIAIAAARAHQRGERSIKLGPPGFQQTFNVASGGWCARLCRQSYECALKIGAFEWPYAASNALLMERALKAGVKRGSILQLSKPEVGCVVGLNYTGKAPGHIALFVGPLETGGSAYIAENSSSTTRGNPRSGTRLTPYSAIQGQVSGLYRAILQAPTGPRIIGPDGNAIDCRPQQDGDGALRADVRPLAEALGYRVDAGEWPKVRLVKP